MIRGPERFAGDHRHVRFAEQLLSEIVQIAWSAGNDEPIDISLDRL